MPSPASPRASSSQWPIDFHCSRSRQTDVVVIAISSRMLGQNNRTSSTNVTRDGRDALSEELELQSFLIMKFKLCISLHLCSVPMEQGVKGEAWPVAPDLEKELSGGS